MVGRATLTMVPSRVFMSWARHTTMRANQRRRSASSRRADGNCCMDSHYTGYDSPSMMIYGAMTLDGYATIRRWCYDFSWYAAHAGTWFDGAADSPLTPRLPTRQG